MIPFSKVETSYFLLELFLIHNSCQKLKMDALMKAPENFEQETSVEEVLDEKLFIEFMKKVPIWDYFAISKQVYLSMSEKEKRNKISKYYSDMKSRQSNSKSISFLFACLIIWNMPLKSEGLNIQRNIQRLNISEKDLNILQKMQVNTY